MKNLAKAKKIINKDNLDVFYWVDWNKDMKHDFVVMHPGSSVNHSAIERHAACLNDLGYPTLLVDPIGFGLSEKSFLKSDFQIQPKYFTTDKYVDTLEQILEAEGIEKKILWGHSHGFIVITELASRKPENVKQIIGVCASDDFMKTAGNTAFVKLFDIVLRYLFEFPGNTMVKISRFVKRPNTTYPDFAPLEGKSDFAANLYSWLKIVGTSYKGTVLNTVHGHVVDNSRLSERIINSIHDIPAIIVYGSDDFMVSSEKASPRMKKIFNNYQILVIPGNHCLPINRPRELTEAISRYLVD
jgi:pimeloyl-ACP methyl ester carboxylesterase